MYVGNSDCAALTRVKPGAGGLLFAPPDNFRYCKGRRSYMSSGCHSSRNRTALFDTRLHQFHSKEHIFARMSPHTFVSAADAVATTKNAKRTNNLPRGSMPESGCELLLQSNEKKHIKLNCMCVN